MRNFINHKVKVTDINKYTANVNHIYGKFKRAKTIGWHAIRKKYIKYTKQNIELRYLQNGTNFYSDFFPRFCLYRY